MFGTAITKCPLLDKIVDKTETVLITDKLNNKDDRNENKKESANGVTSPNHQSESLPKSIIFWRSTTHWIGGMGIIVLTIAILPLLGVGGMQLFSAEAPGPNSDKLHPRITDTAKRLWYIYVGFTLTETVLLNFAGMSFFDAINNSMSTIATGGFSTHDQSFAYFGRYFYGDHSRPFNFIPYFA